MYASFIFTAVVPRGLRLCKFLTFGFSARWRSPNRAQHPGRQALQPSQKPASLQVQPPILVFLSPKPWQEDSYEERHHRCLLAAAPAASSYTQGQVLQSVHFTANANAAWRALVAASVGLRKGTWVAWRCLLGCKGRFESGTIPLSSLSRSTYQSRNAFAFLAG